jgi:hypothetical protein
MRCIATLLTFWNLAALAQDVRRPVELVDLGQFIRTRLRESFGPAKAMSSANGRWAVVFQARPVQGSQPSLSGAPSKDSKSIVVFGDARPRWVRLIDGMADGMTVAANGDICLRQRSSLNVSSLTILDSMGDLKGRETIGAASLALAPLMARMGWRAPSTLPDASEASSHDPYRTFYSAEVTVGLTGDRVGVIRTHFEDFQIYSADGKLLSRVDIDLDSAYRSIGEHVPKIPPSRQGGHHRMFWAVLGEDGLLHICLSGVNITVEPLRVAVIDPYTGTFLRIDRFLLPGSKVRISTANPNGSILPLRAAVGNRTVFLDDDTMVLAIY